MKIRYFILMFLLAMPAQIAWAKGGDMTGQVVSTTTYSITVVKHDDGRIDSVRVEDIKSSMTKDAMAHEERMAKIAKDQAIGVAKATQPKEIPWYYGGRAGSYYIPLDIYGRPIRPRHYHYHR